MCWWEGARVRCCGRRATTRSSMGARAGGGAKLASRTPSELTKITNCNCPFFNHHFIVTRTLISDPDLSNIYHSARRVPPGWLSPRSDRIRGFRELPIEAPECRYASGGTCSHLGEDCALEGDEVIDQSMDRMVNSVMNESGVFVSQAGARGGVSLVPRLSRRRGSERDGTRSKYCAPWNHWEYYLRVWVFCATTKNNYFHWSILCGIYGLVFVIISEINSESMEQVSIFTQELV